MSAQILLVRCLVISLKSQILNPRVGLNLVIILDCLGVNIYTFQLQLTLFYFIYSKSKQTLRFKGEPEKWCNLWYFPIRIQKTKIYKRKASISFSIVDNSGKNLFKNFKGLQTNRKCYQWSARFLKLIRFKWKLNIQPEELPAIFGYQWVWAEFGRCLEHKMSNFTIHDLFLLILSVRAAVKEERGNKRWR